MSVEDQAAAPEPGTPEYDAAMAAKFDAHQNGVVDTAKPDITDPASTEATKATRPEGLPDSFWDAEKGELKIQDLIAAATKAPEAKPADDASKDSTDAAKAAVEDAGLDFDTFSSEFIEKGELSEESYQKLADKGIPKNMVDSFIAGQKAIAAARDAEGYALFGGQEKFAEAAAWAKDGLTEAEKVAFNTAVSGGDEAARMLALQGLKARFQQEHGKAPSLLGGDTNKAASAEAFGSRQEMTQAMRKTDDRGRKLYDIDPAYRSRVQKRIAASNFI